MTKIRVYESKTLADNYSKLAQILHKTMEAMEEAKVSDIELMPPSVVPTSLLYEVAVCYDIMYNMLVDKELLSAGSPKSNNTFH